MGGDPCDTIAAIATPPGEGSVAVLRLSGFSACAIAARVVRRTAVPLLEAVSHTVHHGFVHHPQTGECIDEVLVTVMRAPRTFTREEVVEIGCHGGVMVTKMVLEALLAAGARSAEPGEFTQRAFLNGRIDLPQAEALMDLIHATTEEAARAALLQHQGQFSQLVQGLRDQLLDLLGHLAVNIDYPEYDVEELAAQRTQEQLACVQKQLAQLLAGARQGERLRAGARVVIVGRPNAGKSSLFNAMLGKNKAIVTEIPGTTRDLLEADLTLSGYPIRLVDTAGLRASTDKIEQLGVALAEEAVATADLVLLVVDGSRLLHAMDKRLLAAYPEALVVVSKSELPRKLDEGALDRKPFYISVHQAEGLAALQTALVAASFGEQALSEISSSHNRMHLCNLRQAEKMRAADACLSSAILALKQGVPLDLVEGDMRGAWGALGEVLGLSCGDDLLDAIFSRFCLGK